MDIEGAEILALKGMKKFMERCEELTLFIEYEYNRESIFRFLKEKGFKLYFITRGGELISFKEGKKQADLNLEPMCLATKGDIKQIYSVPSVRER